MSKSETIHFLVRKIDRRVMPVLKQVARTNGKSLEQELRDILTPSAPSPS